MSTTLYARLGKRLFVKVAIATTICATGQAVYLRQWYENTPGLTLPSHMKGIEYGLERVRSTLKLDNEDKKESPNQIINWAKYHINRISFLLRTFRDNASTNNHVETELLNPIVTTGKKVQLLILGDSLARGVGCNNTSPVLPTALAKLLSMALKTDVEWRAEGLIGATVGDIHKKYLPIITEEINKIDNHNTELVIVLICGLNDWKSILTEFPWGSGPLSFHDRLKALIADIKSLAGERAVKIYLPALPLVCGASDPNCILQRAPLKYFVDAISSVWDLQKRYVAEEAPGDAVYIDTPSLSVSYATPGVGNVCSDGVHPSSQGYLWWATHIAHSIIESHLQSQK